MNKHGVMNWKTQATNNPYSNGRNIRYRLTVFIEGWGSQEGIFAEFKTHCQMGYVPVKTQTGNQLYMFTGILVHNLTRGY